MFCLSLFSFAVHTSFSLNSSSSSQGYTSGVQIYVMGLAARINPPLLRAPNLQVIRADLTTETQDFVTPSFLVPSTIAARHPRACGSSC